MSSKGYSARYFGVRRTSLLYRLLILGLLLVLLVVGINILIFGLGLLRGDDLQQMILVSGIGLVAVIPFGLPIVITILLVLTARRINRQPVLIRNLQAVETLGRLTAICSDKADILTENRMTVMALDVADHLLNLTEEVHKGGVVHMSAESPREAVSSISLSCIGAALCNNAALLPIRADEFHTSGDSTEGALLVAAARLDYWKESLDASFPRVAEIPYDVERKRMTTVHSLAEHDPKLLVGLPVSRAKYIAFTKGPVVDLLKLANRVWVNGKFQKMNESWHRRVKNACDEMLSEGMHVLGITFRLLPGLPPVLDDGLETDLTLVGLFGLMNPPRTDVRSAIVACHQAGIHPMMLTGDYPQTAFETARQLGITKEPRIVSGSDIDRMSFDELRTAVDGTSVFALISPEHKLKVVKALQSCGHIVSITGEEDSDISALLGADLGVAMGIGGTEDVKKASDLVLQNNNFASLVAAIAEGRTVVDSIRRVTQFVLVGNISRVLAVALSQIFFRIMPLTPLQLLWLGVLDSLMAVGMCVNDVESKMRKAPLDSRQKSLLSRRDWFQVSWLSLFIGGLALLLARVYTLSDRESWQTVVFTFLVSAQVFQALALYPGRDFVFQMYALRNPLRFGPILLVIGLQTALFYISPLRDFFAVVPIVIQDLYVVVSAGLLVFTAIAVQKALRRKSR